LIADLIVTVVKKRTMFMADDGTGRTGATS